MSLALYTFLPNKSFGKLLDIYYHPKVLYLSKLLTQNFHIFKYGLPIKTLNC